MNFNGQAEQDKFVLNVLKFKKNGFFIEIGSNHPKDINNTYILEKEYDWKGLMVEYSKQWVNLYKEHRPNSIHIINDARKINYKKVLTDNNFPHNMDYLQIDLEVENGSTLETLQLLDEQIFDEYKFATITFEHDIYRSNFKNTRLESRKIFERRGYILLFPDICNLEDIYVYEDWYIHPDLVDTNYIQQLKEKNIKNYFECKLTGKTISWDKIEY